MSKFYKGYDGITASEPFKQRMVRTLQSETRGETAVKPVRLPIKRRTLAILIAAAVMVLAIGTAAAATIIAKNYYSPDMYMMQDKEQREQTQNAIPDIENAIASAKPVGGDSSVVMLPEMDNADALNEWRQKMGQPVYSEEDWGWIRDIRPEIEEVLVDGSTIAFNVRLNTDHGKNFDLWNYTEDRQRVDAACDEAVITFTKDGRTIDEFVSTGTGINPGSITENGATLGSEIDLVDLSEPLPTEGTVHVVMTIGVRDAKVDDMADIGLLANITYSFDFDASAGADVADPIVTERPLSGSVVLTGRANGRDFNKRVSLDGVVLEETLNFRKTGIYVTYRVKSAPEEWYRAPYEPELPGEYVSMYRDMLLDQGSDSGSVPGFYVTCVPKGSTDGDAVIVPGKANAMVGGEYICILPFFPSDYEQIKATGYEIRLYYQCVSAFNGEPVGEDWILPKGADGYDLDTIRQPIASFDLKLP